MIPADIQLVLLCEEDIDPTGSTDLAVFVPLVDHFPCEQSIFLDFSIPMVLTILDCESHSQAGLARDHGILCPSIKRFSKVSELHNYLQLSLSSSSFRSTGKKSGNLRCIVRILGFQDFRIFYLPGSSRRIQIALPSQYLLIFLSDPCAHGVRSLGSNVCTYKTFLKPCEDLVKTVNVVNVVKTQLMKTSQ